MMSFLFKISTNTIEILFNSENFDLQKIYTENQTVSSK